MNVMIDRVREKSLETFQLAIEVYPTAANAPTALSSKFLTNSGCGIVAIWTGAR